jgi:hypothetical protein
MYEQFPGERLLHCTHTTCCLHHDPSSEFGGRTNSHLCVSAANEISRNPHPSVADILGGVQ